MEKMKPRRIKVHGFFQKMLLHATSVSGLGVYVFWQAKIKRLLPLLFLLIILFVVYHPWFGVGILSGGDFAINFPSMYSNSYLHPYAWYWNQGAGLGGNAISLLWIYFNYATSNLVFGEILGLPWGIFERVAYFYPFLLIGVISSITLARYVFTNKIYAFFSPLIFLINTYILMIGEGGQIWILLSYSLSPLALYLFIKNINTCVNDAKKKSFHLAILTGLVFSLLLMLELRMAYITLFAGLIYWLLGVLNKGRLKVFLKAFLFAFVIPGILSFGIHAFWLLPTIILRQNPADQFSSAYITEGAVRFFSFAKLENTISLLHPNWFENIFGKVSFMKPEFLLLPMLAYMSLLFTKRKNEKHERTYVIFFAILGLIGIFLAKGANDPLGGAYIWMFNHIPGFIMFRDPTKWYLLVAISYSILIPFSTWKIYEWLKSHVRFTSKSRFFNLQNLFIVLITGYILLLVRPALGGQLKGTFKPASIPSSYIRLENFLSSQKTFFRVLWVPQIQRFGLNSIAHPAVPSEGFFGESQIEKVLDELKKEKTKKDLIESAVKYVIVPYDTKGEIYIKDRKYDEALYLKTIGEVSKIGYLNKIDGFGKIGVYEVSGTKKHFWSPSNLLEMSYENISPVEYRVKIKNAKKGTILIFSESYDPKWVATTITDKKIQVPSTKYERGFNSFVLPQDGDYALNVYYSPQKYVEVGLIVSLTTFASVILFFILSLVRRKNQ